MKAKKSEAAVLLFDGVCNLCNGLVQFTIQRDPTGRFHFASLQSASGQKILKKYKLPVRDLDTFVFVKDGKAFVKSTAGFKMLKELGGFWSLFYVFMLVPVPIRDWIYDRLAQARYPIFGKRKVCMVPTSDVKSRFL
jgi:predicted DCC family thiol-disulfide oxidoreductase YuxK